MYEIDVTLETISELLMNAPEVPKERKPGKKKTEAYYKEQAKEKVHLHPKLKIPLIPLSIFKKTLGAGCTAGGVKIGKKSARQLIGARVWLKEKEGIFISRNGKPLKTYDELDVRWGKIPPGPKGAMQLIYRPRFNPPCQLHFTLMVDDDVPATAIRDSLGIAGTDVGLASGRGEPFYCGRFIVTQWDVKETS